MPCGVKPVYLWSKSNKVMFIVVGNSETLKMVNLLKIPRNPGPVDEKAAKDEKTVIVWWKGYHMKVVDLMGSYLTFLS